MKTGLEAQGAVGPATQPRVPGEGPNTAPWGLERLRAEEAAARRFAEAQHAPATRRAYASDFAVFSAWCAERGLTPLPASPNTVAAFVASQAEASRRASTISRRLAAIRQAHARAGFESPTRFETVKATLKGIRRALRVAPSQKAPATVGRLAAMLAKVPNTLAGVRDRAILLLGFAGAFRRSELASLRVCDLEFPPEGLQVHIRRAKTDQDGEGQVVAILRGEVHCPLLAVRAWLEASAITDGPLFRPFAKGDRMLAGALSPHTIGAIVKAYAARAGLDPIEFGGHSLRAGFLTAAAAQGASIWKLLEVSRHRSIGTLQGYVRDRDGFRDHAGIGLL